MRRYSEKVYYEFLLSRGQLAVAVILLVGCTVAMLSAGIWIGFRVGKASLSAPESRAVVSQGGSGVGLVEAAGRRSQESGEAVSRPSSGDDLVEADPPPSRASAPRLRGDAPSGRTRPRADLPSRRASQTEGSWVVQVMSSSDEKQATLLTQRLKAAGYPAFVSLVRLEDSTRFRVRVGTYPARREAEMAASELRRLHGLDTWIIQ